MTESTAPAVPVRAPWHYLKPDFNSSSWNSIEPYFKELLERPVNSKQDLEKWLSDQSELESVLSEYNRWIYVRTTVDTTDAKAKADQLDLYTNIFPHLAAYSYELDRKLISSPFLSELDHSVYFPFIRKVKGTVEIFRQENVEIQSRLSLRQSRYDEIIGAQTISFEGNEYTMQQAQVLLKSSDRAKREAVYKLMAERRAKDKDELDNLLTELIGMRHQLALNAGFKNYTEYRFKELGRFDYSADDCITFHQSVKDTVCPLLDILMEERKKMIGVDVLKPWDTDADKPGEKALRPASTGAELIQKTIDCFRHLDSYFAERIEIMRAMNYLDVESRVGKGPGGYNMSMPEIGVPFIFMNAANAEHDLITMVHEGGHAVHTFLSHPLPLTALKDVPSEIAEVASMGMELMTIPYWSEFYATEEEVTRARKNHLKYIVNVLAKTCLGDAFQHWLYNNPTHSVQERRSKWIELSRFFTSSLVDYSGFEYDLEIGYQRIMHFYAVPFYYIEYAFAELGAIALYKNFKADRQKAISDYKAALTLGYTKTIPEFYATAGVRFDFSKKYVSELVQFLQAEIAG